jgi:ribonucleoside-diphosphate reductase alpha chain
MAKHYKIVKRNGEIVPLDITKIRQVIEWASEGLDINPIELESNLHMRFKNNMTTKEIQENVIDTSLQLTSIEEPDWRILAARLKLMDLYKDVKFEKDYKTFGYDNYLRHVKKSIKEGLYDEDLTRQYSDEELKVAGSFMNVNYDMDFDYAGANLMINRYLLTRGDKPWELPQEAFLTAALLIERFQPAELRMDRVKDTYEKLAQRKLSLATPMLMNLRKPYGNLSSCFIAAMDDSRDSIYYVIDQIAEISKNGGGVGLNISRVRCAGSWIGGMPNASGGIVPWVRNVNDTVVAVNQQGKRAGACTVALDIWHMDIEDFLELQTENGDQRTKAFDIFPQVVIPDNFMRKNKRKDGWLLVDPYEIKVKLGENIAEAWGEDFDRLYKRIERMVYKVGDDAGINLKELEDEAFEEAYGKLIKGKADLQDKKHLKLVRRVNARELFKTIMKTQVETGMPYLTFKDAMNRANPNKHDGMIGNGNLCQESYSNFRPSEVIEHTVEEENGEKIIVRKTKAGLVHTCNLNSLNVSNINSEAELHSACETAVRLLDNAIDFTDVPIKEGEIHNNTYRTIGVGTMGLADYLAKNNVAYSKAQDAVEELFENIAYYTINASISLAKERGAYPKYEGSDWSKGLILGRDIEWYKANTKDPERWVKTFERLAKYGIRNSHLHMIAPNTSSSLVQGCSASVLPVFSKFYVDKNSKGAVPIMPPFVKDSFWYYQEFKNIPQKEVVDIISRIQKWTDTGISMELIFNLNLPEVNAKYMFETLVDAWEKDMKTVYYIRSVQKNSSDVSEKEECISCSG